jgi:hypothetical protein
VSWLTYDYPKSYIGIDGPAGLSRAEPGCFSIGPEVTNGLFLSHKRTERERRWARVAEFRRKRPQPAHGVDRKQVFPDRPRHHLTDRWKLATHSFPWTSRFARSAYVRLCVKSERSVTSGLAADPRRRVFCHRAPVFYLAVF